MSRRISKIDGTFGGIILAAVDPLYFSDFFASVDQGSNRFMALVLDDGASLFVGPGNDATRDPIVDFMSEDAKKTRSPKRSSPIPRPSITPSRSIPTRI